MQQQVEFVITTEAGVLERQALLLCESIRYFAGELAASQITVVSPRKARRPSAATVKKLGQLQVEYLPLELDSPCPDYGPSFKVRATAHVARRPGPPIVVQLDTDTVFLGEPLALLKPGSVAARPVDVKGMCSAGRKDPFDAYWRTLCTMLGVDYERLPMVRTTVDRIWVRASYNGGLVAAPRASGIFQLTEEFLLRLIAAGMKPWGAERPSVRSGVEVVSEVGSSYWGTSQAALSLAIVRAGQSVDMLPATYNFPLHLFTEVAPAAPAPLVHMHYHWLASSAADGADRLVDPRLEMLSQVREWLRSRLPLDAPV